jgi:hypothetical protein
MISFNSLFHDASRHALFSQEVVRRVSDDERRFCRILVFYSPLTSLQPEDSLSQCRTNIPRFVERDRPSALPQLLVRRDEARLFG